MSKDYWDKINEEYHNFPQEKTDENILVWYDAWQIKNQELLDKYGSISWLMLEVANMLRNEAISEGKFRELVRFCLDKELKDKLKETAVELYKSSFRGYWCEEDDKCNYEK